MPQLSQVKLPNGNTYELVDKNGRALIAPAFATTSTYSAGDYVLYDNGSGIKLYKAKSNLNAGAWNANNWTATEVGPEMVNLRLAMGQGVNYRGIVTTSLYEGATAQTLALVGGGTLTATQGDLVIVQPGAYAASKAYNAGEFITYSSTIYEIRKGVSAAQNTGFAALDTVAVQTEPEFIFDGTTWNLFGATSNLGKMALADSASGSTSFNVSYPTGSGSVTVPTYSATKQALATSSIYGVQSTTEAVSLVETDGTEAYTTGGSPVVYGKANVGTGVNVGTSLTGTTSFNVDGVKVSVNGETLEFANATNGTVGLGTSSITPAVAAPNTQTITPAVASINVTKYKITSKNVAKKDSNATIFATGKLAQSDTNGATIATDINESSTTKDVTVNTSVDTVPISITVTPDARI